jgi:hypothetical protein
MLFRCGAYRPGRAADAARPYRRGDRISLPLQQAFLLHLLTAAFALALNVGSLRRSKWSGIESAGDDPPASSAPPPLTRSGLRWLLASSPRVADRSPPIRYPAMRSWLGGGRKPDARLEASRLHHVSRQRDRSAACSSGCRTRTAS